MQILVDMDGVIASWNTEYDRLLDIEDPYFTVTRTPNQRTFDLFSGRSKEQQDIILKVMNTPGFYANLEPIPGAKEALNEMIDLGHTVFLVSSPFPSNPTCASDKFDWVEKHYGHEWTKRTILTMDKTAVSGDVLIDDKPEVKGAATPDWEHIVFDCPWNRAVSGKRRILDWSDWKSVVLEPALVAA
jgi:5'-nucleotidase